MKDGVAIWTDRVQIFHWVHLIFFTFGESGIRNIIYCMALSYAECIPKRN
jgi:hypothetical protein